MEKETLDIIKKRIVRPIEKEGNLSEAGKKIMGRFHKEKKEKVAKKMKPDRVKEAISELKNHNYKWGGRV